MDNQIQKRTILIADDEPNVRKLVGHLLSESYTVIGVGDGEDVIDVALKHKPDIILMDIMMPNVDGYRACYAIKSNPATRAIPVVMLTGIGHELNRKLSQQIGADGYITKPFGLNELKEVIGRLLSSD